MRIEVDTSHDSHDDIKKVIKMLQHLVGDSQEIFTNNPQEAASPMANIFGNMAPAVNSEMPAATEATQEPARETAEAAEASESTEDLFAELFSEEEIKKMDAAKTKEEEEDEEEEIKPKSKDKKYGIEFY
jgi:septal ring factor EnvC (AmiA/AmiB activator)